MIDRHRPYQGKGNPGMPICCPWGSCRLRQLDLAVRAVENWYASPHMNAHDLAAEIKRSIEGTFALRQAR